MQKSNVTGTGIAVAIAVVIALVFLFLGPNILALFSAYPASSTAAATSTQPITQNLQTATTSIMDNSASSNSNALSGIPANPTQLMTKDEVVGTGSEAQVGDTVTVNYVGMLTNGTIFDASANHGTTGFTFPLGAGQVIKGWDEGVVGMKVGGKRELVIPASLGYGNQAVGSIPANSTLVFEIELLNVQSGSK
jgi:FKBP-type peptidyl-prolyl cis-trans isomerase FkpA